MNDYQRGLYRKYHVERLNDPTGKHKDCQYYVLDLAHDKFAGPALRAYAYACEVEYPSLAADLRQLAGERVAIRAEAEKNAEKGSQPALRRYIDLGGDSEHDPVERLRFFCSLSMTGQDWIDVERFFTEINKLRTNAEKAAEAPQNSPQSLPRCGYADTSAVQWNEYNSVVQCHNCGQVYAIPSAPDEALIEEIANEFALTQAQSCFAQDRQQNIKQAIREYLKRREGK
jgi:hypothetical protein